MRPAALDWSVENCTIGRAMAVLGEKWTMVVLREVFSGIRRFDDMRVRTNIPRQVLTNRLANLVEEGILRRVPYQEPGSRVRYEYRLTEKGFDLQPIMIAVRQWGDKHLADEEGPSFLTEHRDCGERIRLHLVCGAGHEVQQPRAVVTVPGPTARRLEHSGR
jgi:DNA-binding HxlR family transcriptional regulator